MSSTRLCQEAQTMLARILYSLCLDAVGSAAFGRAVNAVIVLAPQNASPCDRLVISRAGATDPIR